MTDWSDSMVENKNINILIVDDRKENLLVLESILQSLKVNIITANSGNEGLGFLFDKQFAVVLIDVQMPGMDGFEMAEIMRSSERTRHIPIIFVTAISKEQEYVFKGYDSGAVDYLFKPIREPKVIMSKVKIFIDIYKQKQMILDQASMLENKIKELEETKHELEKANAILEQLSYYDKLTGIANRHSLENHFNMMLKKAIRDSEELSALMVDIDCFKEFNDNYGHVQGDICLRKIADSIKHSLKRPLDFVARYGGEEFIILLPETNLEGAVKVAQSIKEKVENLEVVHKYSKAAEVVTVSIGAVSLVPSKVNSIDEIVDNADKALYKAKNQGRNRVVGCRISTHGVSQG